MNIKALLSKIKQKATSGRGRSIFTFLIFLLISTIFWFMMTLNETIQRDYRLPIEIAEIPAGTTFITSPPQYIDVSVKDKGRALIKYDWGNPPKVRIRYRDFIKKVTAVLSSIRKCSTTIYEIPSVPDVKYCQYVRIPSI